MNLLNRFTLTLFIDILPDGILNTLSNNFKVVNNMIYYDEDSMTKMSKILTNLDNYNYLKIAQLYSPDFLQQIYLVDVDDINLHIKIITNNIKYFTNIKEITIYYDNIPIEYYILKNFVETITNNKTLSKLTLVGIGLDNDGSKLFAELFKNNKVLKYVNFAANNIGDQGVISITNGLIDNCSLRALGLEQNPITDNSVPVLKDLLKKCPIGIDIFDTQISEDNPDEEFYKLYNDSSRYDFDVGSFSFAH